MDRINNPKRFPGRGFKFPVQIDEATGRFKMSSYEEDIQEAIYIILNTRIGERPMRPEFGCRIHDYMFESLNYTVLSSMKDAVREALEGWEPRIRDIEIDIDQSMISDGIVNIHINYTVRRTNSGYSLVYPFHMDGEA